jgi:hypothetical protein
MFVDTSNRTASDSNDPPGNSGDEGADGDHGPEKRDELPSPATVVLRDSDTNLVSLLPCVKPSAQTTFFRCLIVATASGDVDGDGYADVALLTSTMIDDENARANLNVFFGPFTPNSTPISVGTPSLSTNEQLVMDFATDMIIFDDGTLAIASWRADLTGPQSGAVLIMREVAYGHSATHTSVLVPPPDFYNFGTALTSCDVDHDGVQDLIVAAHHMQMGDTALFLYRGKGVGVLDTLPRTIVQPGTAGSTIEHISCGNVGAPDAPHLLVRSVHEGTRSVHLFSAGGNDDAAPLTLLFAKSNVTADSWGNDAVLVDGIGVAIGTPGVRFGAGGAVVYRGNWSSPKTTIFSYYGSDNRAGSALATEPAFGSLPGFIALGAPGYRRQGASSKSTGAALLFKLLPEEWTPADSPSSSPTTASTSTSPNVTTAPSVNPGSSSMATELSVLGLGEGEPQSSLNPRLIAGLGAAAIVVVLGLLMAVALWLRRRRRADPKSAVSEPTSSASAVASTSRRPTRGASASRLNRTGSRSAVRTRRSRAPTASADRPPVTAYGETSLAVPHDQGQYAQTSLYPSPMDGAASVEYMRVPVRPVEQRTM